MKKKKISEKIREILILIDDYIKNLILLGKILSMGGGGGGRKK